MEKQFQLNAQAAGFETTRVSFLLSSLHCTLFFSHSFAHFCYFKGGTLRLTQQGAQSNYRPAEARALCTWYVLKTFIIAQLSHTNTLTPSHTLPRPTNPRPSPRSHRSQHRPYAHRSKHKSICRAAQCEKNNGAREQEDDPADREGFEGTVVIVCA